MTDKSKAPERGAFGRWWSEHFHHKFNDKRLFDESMRIIFKAGYAAARADLAPQWQRVEDVDIEAYTFLALYHETYGPQPRAGLMGDDGEFYHETGEMMSPQPTHIMFITPPEGAK
jgi:hypothetical protein